MSDVLVNDALIPEWQIILFRWLAELVEDLAEENLSEEVKHRAAEVGEDVLVKGFVFVLWGSGLGSDEEDVAYQQRGDEEGEGHGVEKDILLIDLLWLETSLDVISNFEDCVQDQAA